MLGLCFYQCKVNQFLKSASTYFLKKTKRIGITGIMFQSEAFIWNKQVKWEKYQENLHYSDFYLKYYAYVTMKGDKNPEEAKGEGIQSL
jgi:hypothetical protein